MKMNEKTKNKRNTKEITENRKEREKSKYKNEKTGGR